MLQLCLVRVQALSVLYKMHEDDSGNVEFQDQIDTALTLALGRKRATENVEWRGGRTECAGRTLRPGAVIPNACVAGGPRRVIGPTSGNHLALPVRP